MPHLWDVESATLAGTVERAGALLVDVRQDPEYVIRQIASCDHVFSASLHGLIVADSFEIPTIRAMGWEVVSSPERCARPV